MAAATARQVIGGACTSKTFRKTTAAAATMTHHHQRGPRGPASDMDPAGLVAVLNIAVPVRHYRPGLVIGNVFNAAGLRPWCSAGRQRRF